MISSLDDAVHQASDVPSASSVQLVSTVRTGRPGRPRHEFNKNLLENFLQISKKSTIAKKTKVSARTVCRRALELQLESPGQPVFVNVEAPEGTLIRVHQGRTQPSISDAELDAAVERVRQVFPEHGRQLLWGQLRSMGINVTRDRLEQSSVRVNGLPRAFGRHKIQRRTYQVPGANSLWHHDGQHGKSIVI
jgi:hypothetical protein